MFSQRWLWLAALALATTGVSSAQTTWWVDTNAAGGGDGSQTHPFRWIQHGVDAALDGDTVLVQPGFYAESVRVDDKAISIVSNGPPEATTIHGNGSGSVVELRCNAPRLQGFTVENGTGTALLGETIGGGILIFDTSGAQVLDCIVRDNFARRGAGIGAFLGAHALVRNCVIEDNTAIPPPFVCDWGEGGGIYGSLNVLVQDSTLRRNVAGQDGGGAWGVELAGCTVEDNVSARGAGLFQGVARSSQLVRNLAHSCDGSFSNAGGAYSSTLEDCTLEDNEAWDQGGGAENSTLLRCRLLRNRATSPELYWASGGGTLNCDATECWYEGNWTVGLPWNWPSDGGGAAGGTATRCVFVANQADQGAGTAWTRVDRCTVIGNLGEGVRGMPISNSIIRGNTGGQIAMPDWVVYSDVEGGYPGLGNVDLDPQFWDPASKDYRLMPTSPCIDAGDPFSTDPDGSRTDMGAFPYDASDPLPPVFYCGGGHSVDPLCTPALSLAGTPSVSAPSGFTVQANDVPGSRMGVVLFGTSGEVAVPWGTSTSCVRPPRYRTGTHFSLGTAGTCQGVLSVDFNLWLSMHGSPLAAGTVVWMQAWYRDPAAALGTNFSDAVRFSMLP
jgi:hypothetical protein